MKRFLLSAVFLAAHPAFADQPVEITFAAELGGQPFSCLETYDGIGAGTAPVQVLDYRMFVSEPALITTDGTAVPIALEQDGAWQVENVALLDFENATGSCTNGTGATNMTLRGTVPDGEYTGLSFAIGVPFDWNHGDPTVAPSPLNLTAMFWNWRAGYKFIKFETSPVAGDGMNKASAAHSEGDGHGHGDNASSGWFLHLGSTMCAAPSRTEAPSEACANPNVMQVAFDAFDPASHVVVVDPAPVIADADLATNTPETSPGCMSFPNDSDCNTVLPRLGLDFNAFGAEDQLLVSKR
ncbi:metallo-mystery pair system four-Cys motif protein [Tateyamaria omphalii]|uniref:MbnP family copper-binding protein n=1 Tax=Tateyamaria omphalii TaxID=299262 RepID=UPI001673442A|nr:MbnP family copper-binding protein [Tateyamaria omphalii]GGX42940.1 metallo-mystery pair system four-Cys motif protein [Tateyamaria omphalii]